MCKVRGFTLIEMIIVLVISVLLITIGLPSFKTLIQNTRLTAATSSIQQDLFFARSQAMNYLNYVTVCPLENNTCGNNWQTGLDIFIDSDLDPTYDSDEVLLKTGSPFNSSDTLVLSKSHITFEPDGNITGSSALFRYCSDDDRAGISIAYTGRAKIVASDAFADCN